MRALTRPTTGSVWRHAACFAVLLLTGCATTTPQQQERRELLSRAARDCQIRYPFVERLDFDRFDRLLWVYREGATQGQRDAFSDCYGVRVRELTQAATVQGPAAPARGASTRPAAPGPPGAPAAAAPVWKPGFEWTFRWESPRGSGTFVWSVTREETVGGEHCYVVWSGPLEIYWRTSDFASVLQKRLGRVELQYTPPRHNMMWPLSVGRSWEQLFVVERPLDRQTANRLWTWQVERTESVKVPAGTFDTWKIVVRDKWANSLVWEYWYSPDVRQIARSREVLSYGVETRELTKFKLGDGDARQRAPTT